MPPKSPSGSRPVDSREPSANRAPARLSTPNQSNGLTPSTTPGNKGGSHTRWYDDHDDRLRNLRYTAAQDEDEERSSSELDELSLFPTGATASPQHLPCFNCASAKVTCEEGSTDEQCKRCEENPRKLTRCNVNGRIPKYIGENVYEKVAVYIGRYREATLQYPFVLPSAEPRSWGSNGRKEPDYPTEIARLKSKGCLPKGIAEEDLGPQDALEAFEDTDWMELIAPDSQGKITPLKFRDNWLRREEQRSSAARQAHEEHEPAQGHAPGATTASQKRKATGTNDWQPKVKKRFVDGSREGDVVGIVKYPGSEDRHVDRWLRKGAAGLLDIVAQLRAAAAWRHLQGKKATHPTYNYKWWDAILEACKIERGKEGEGGEESEESEVEDAETREEGGQSCDGAQSGTSSVESAPASEHA